MTKPCAKKSLNDRKYSCFFELTLQIIGGKWKPVILYQLAINDVMRFSELNRAVPDITERMLTRQLRELEKDRLIHREVYRQIPPKVEYSLLPPGVKLIPILLSMRKWGVEYEAGVSGEDLFIGEGYEPKTPPAIAERYRDQLQEEYKSAPPEQR